LPSGFLKILLLVDGRIRIHIGSGSARIRTESRSGRPKNLRILYVSGTLHETSCPEVQFQPCLGIAKVQYAVNNILFFSIWKKEVAFKLQRIV
jgi:hypothetical protein